MRLRHYILQIDVLLTSIYSVQIKSVLGILGSSPILTILTHIHKHEKPSDTRGTGLCHWACFSALWPFQPLIPSDPDQKYHKGFQPVSWDF